MKIEAALLRKRLLDEINLLIHRPLSVAVISSPVSLSVSLSSSLPLPLSSPPSLSPPALPALEEKNESDALEAGSCEAHAAATAAFLCIARLFSLMNDFILQR